MSYVAAAGLDTREDVRSAQNFWRFSRWVLTDFSCSRIPDLIEALCLVKPSDEELLNAFISLFRFLCSGIGYVFTAQQVSSFLIAVLMTSIIKTASKARAGNTLSSPITPILRTSGPSVYLPSRFSFTFRLNRYYSKLCRRLKKTSWNKFDHLI